MKLAFVQTRPRFGEPERNVRDAMSRAVITGADLVVLPELFSTGYQFRSRGELLRLAQSARDGLEIAAAHEVARRTGAFLVGGFAERAGRRIFNAAFLVGPDGLVGVYRKIHLFSRENELFDPGDRPPRVFDIGRARVGIMICFDWLFPELARSLALMGAQVLAHPANLVLPYCQRAMVTRCLENGVFAVTANRVGAEERIPGERLVFTGSSRILGPDGAVLAAGRRGAADARTVEIDPRRADDKSLGARNDRLADRRPRLYRLRG